MDDRKIILTGRWLILLIGVVWSAFPIFMVVSSSFKPALDIFAVPPKLIFTPTFENYIALFHDWPEFVGSLGNSLIITVGATLITAVTSLLAGYSYSRYRSRLLTLSAFFMIFVRMLPPIVVTIPLFPVVNALHLNDTYIILILLYAAFFVSLATWIVKTFIDQIPRELEEAAEVEGASIWQMLYKVIVNTARTGPLILSEISGAVEGVQWGVLFAATSIQLLPILIFVLFVQKFIVSGLTAGAVKG
jgi:multiple sugar transport system permease protein